MNLLRAWKKHLWIFLLAMAAVGVALDLFVIRHGVGATGDAVWYMQGAQNILKGYGYGILRGDGFLPTTLYPPFYSIVLAGLGLSGAPIFTLAGAFNALLFGANIFLAGWLAYRLTGSTAAALLVGAFNLLCIDLFVIHTWAMTEPLYITLTLLSLLFLLKYQEKGRRSILALAGLAAGLSVVTRYVGISLVAALALWILFAGKRTRRQRLLDAVLLGSSGILPVAIFVLRNAALTGSLAGRSAAVFRSIPAQNFADMALTITAWFFPGIAYHLPALYVQISCIGLVLLSAALFVISVRTSARSGEEAGGDYTRFETLLLMYIVLYISTFMASIYLSLAGSPASWTATQISRYLIPVFPVFVLLAALVFLRLQRALAGKAKIYGRAATAVALAFLALYAYTFSGLRNRHIYLGYTEIRNDYPDLVTELGALDPSRPIVASNYELVSFLVDRPIYSMPGEGDELTGAANPNLPQLLAKISALIDRGAVLVVYRPTPGGVFYFEPLLGDLTLLNSYGDGTISILLYAKTDLGQ